MLSLQRRRRATLAGKGRMPTGRCPIQTLTNLSTRTQLRTVKTTQDKSAYYPVYESSPQNCCQFIWTDGCEAAAFMAGKCDILSQLLARERARVRKSRCATLTVLERATLTDFERATQTVFERANVIDYKER
eukprot:5101753-Pleurochrysis_carterae.AAC.1